MREANYWSEKTQISDALPENEWQKNYDLFMNNLHGHAFAQFLAEAGISAKDTMIQTTIFSSQNFRRNNSSMENN